MSPTPFAQQISYLLDTLSSCDTHCTQIRQNRSLGSTTMNLDNLQSSLATSTVAIESRYTTLERLIGSRMQVGDDISRNALNRSIRELESDIEIRLHAIGNKKGKGSGDEKAKKVGFGNMNKKVTRIEEEVFCILDSLAARIGSPQPPSQQQSFDAPQSPHQQRKDETDEVIISLKELDVLVKHLKDSWIEKSVVGKVLYVNCFDSQVSQWEKPDGGFIRSLPRTKKPSPQMTERVREDEDAEEEIQRRRERKERRARESKEKRETAERESRRGEQEEHDVSERELEDKGREMGKERGHEAFERNFREQQFRDRERLRRMAEEGHQKRRPRTRPDLWEGQQGW